MYSLYSIEKSNKVFDVPSGGFIVLFFWFNFWTNLLRPVSKIYCYLLFSKFRDKRYSVKKADIYNKIIIFYSSNKIRDWKYFPEENIYLELNTSDFQLKEQIVGFQPF